MIFVAFLFSSTTNFICGQASANKSDSAMKLQVPKVVLVYPEDGGPFDKNCGAFLNKPVKDGWIQEAAKRLGEFQFLYDNEGPKYVKTALEEVGGLYPYKEVQATLTVCHFSSMSSPLIVNVNNFLSTADDPLPLFAFTEILFHELMHTYTRPAYEKSPLIKKYATEPPLVLVHLHVMALEKFVLQKLGRTHVLKWKHSSYGEGGPGYKRAWEIVDKIEGHEAFINELKLVYKKEN
jgi:hypothetical protein